MPERAVKDVNRKIGLNSILIVLNISVAAAGQKAVLSFTGQMKGNDYLADVLPLSYHMTTTLGPIS
jgi:hypothetical protein